MAKLKLIDVCKVYKGNVKAVNNFNLDIKDGEFLVFVGPSGCGKSTTLRMIAGLEKITSGKIYIDNKLINDLEPKDRDIAMVFQNYALYPHMSVYDNLAYSLKCHHTDKKEIDKKVNEVASMLDISQFLLRTPKELSGGQRQRVALGRCLIRSPKLFLFDEPLSNLDAKLRVSMRSEISKLHKKLNGTFIYVTHDQTEAMTMGDRIVVMKDGVIQQCDTPVNLYEHPSNVFVATFLGSPQMNIFNVHLKDKKIMFSEDKYINLSEKLISKLVKGYEDSDVQLGIRPSDFRLGTKEDYDIYVPEVDLTEKLGNETLVYFNMLGREEATLASLKLDIVEDISNELYLKIDNDKLHLFNMDGESILKVNDVNYISADVKISNDTAIINNEIEYKNYSSKCVDDNYLKDFKGYMSLPSDKLTIEEVGDSYKIEVVIKAIDIYSDKKVYYGILHDGSNTRITFYSKKNKDIKKDELITLYINKEDIDLYDENYNKLTINEGITKPFVDIDMKKIGRDYYLLSNSSDFCKNKYFKITQLYDLKNKMIIEAENSKGSLVTFRTERNTDLYVDELLYIKHMK